MILSEKLNEFLNIFFEGKTFDINEICKGGSDRKFYRVSNENKSCILSISSDLAEYRYYSSFANYFQIRRLTARHTGTHGDIVIAPK